jgi:hypothetical protein
MAQRFASQQRGTNTVHTEEKEEEEGKWSCNESGRSCNESGVLHGHDDDDTMSLHLQPQAFSSQYFEGRH